MSELIITERSNIVAIADAVRSKTGETKDLNLGEIVECINDIGSESGSTGLDTSDATASASDILSGKTAYVKGVKVTGNIATKASSDLTASGATVTVPSGYYASNASKSVATATQATPTISVNGSGLITASATQTAGYVNSGTKSATSQLTTQAAKTVTPSTSSQIAVSKGMYTTGDITVGAIPSDYIKPSGTLNITTNGTHDVTNYASAVVNITTSGGGSVGSSVYPDGAFAPVSSFTDGKQYALVALIDGVYRYINTTTYNNYTMNATSVSITENAGDYVIFGTTPALFTAVASGDGFLLQNGTNYLHGTTSNGTALRVGTTQAVWKVDNSETGGFSDGKYLVKEDENSVWLFNNSGGYDWSIKYETAGSFGYDRNGRDNTYSTGFASFILYEYVAGESYGGGNSVVDTSDANVTADKMLSGYSGYAKGKKIEGAIQLQSKTAKTNGTVTPDEGCLLSSVVVDVSSSGGLTVPTTITAGDTPVLFSSTMAHTCTSTSATATGISITVPRAGTYRFKFSCARTNTSGTWTAQLRKNGSAVSGATATWSQYQGSYSGDVTCNANDKIEIYATSRGTSYRLITGQLIACINWDTGF